MKKNILLITVLVLGFFLRVYKINSLPALNADEAAIGYNTYSLLKTGLDEHGNSWPIHFQSFNDYKPGGYFYLTLPFVKIFGLNIYSVRLPNVILSTLTILVVYYLVLELFENSQLAIFSSFLLAISPWHIHFSRGGWEASTATFFITLGFLLFTKAVNGFKWGFSLSALIFAFSLYTYHSARIVSPLLVITLVIYYRKTILKNIKPFLIAGIIGSIVLIPLIRDLVTPGAISRAAGVGLFADQGPINRINEQRGAYKNIEGVIPKIIHNKFINYSLVFMENWSSHYHGEFLFISGDEIQRNKVPETGELYLFEILTIALGLVMIIKKSKNWFPIFTWLVIAPIPSSLTFQSPHALRAQNMVIPLEIISAYGLLTIWNYFKKIKNKYLFVACFLLFETFIIWNLMRYLHMYYIHLDKEYPFSSQYGVEELASYVQKNYNNYDQIYISDKYDQPYILFLFYLKYPPEKFQYNHVLTSRDKFGFSTVKDFDKFHFGPIDLNTIKSKHQRSLVAVSTEEISSKESLLKKIYFSNGNPAFKIIETK